MSGRTGNKWNDHPGFSTSAAVDPDDDDRGVHYETKNNCNDYNDEEDNYDEDNNESKSIDDEEDENYPQENEQVPLFVSFTTSGKNSNSTSSSSSVPVIHILPQQEPIDASFLRSSIPPSLLKLAVSRTDGIPTSYEGQRKISTSSSSSNRRLTVRKNSKSSSTFNKIINQPVTFRAQVKSSGYGSVAPRKPGWAKAAAQRIQSSSSSSSSSSAKLLQVTHSYRYDNDNNNNNNGTTVPNQVDEDIFGIHPKTITSRTTIHSSSSASVSNPNLSSSFFPMGSIATIGYSYDGTHLAIGSHDSSLYSVRLGLGSGSLNTANNTFSDRGNNNVSDQSSVVSISPPSKLQLRLLGPSTKHALSIKNIATNISNPTSNNGATSPVSSKNGITSISWSHGTYKGLSYRLQQNDGKKSTKSSSIDTSIRNRLLLTNNSDNGVSVWAGASGRTDPVLSITPPSLASSSSSTSSSFLSSSSTVVPVVSAASFYYIDKFIVCAAGDNIYAYSWLLNNDSINTDENLPNNESLSKATKVEEDVTRLRNKNTPSGKSTITTQWKANTNGSTINCLAAHNTFRSPLIFTTSLDRSVRIYDCGQSSVPQEMLHIPDAHTRMIHSLILPTASTFAEVSGTAMNCFLTASTDSIGGLANGGTGLLRLWDLRVNKCVRQLTGSHSNRVHTCSATFSPDLMYIATGSEDRSVVIYDLRKDGDCLMKLRGATDTVTTVAWHPLLPHIASGSLDGNVRFFRTSSTGE